MGPRQVKTACLAALIVSPAFTIVLAQTQAPSKEEPLQAAEKVVARLYKSVTFEAGSPPDWQKVRSLFMDEAVIVLRTNRDKMSVFSVKAFIDDFVHFVERPAVRQNGFKERIVRTKPMLCGDIAHILVLYEASIPGSPRPPQQGIDSFQLIRKDGRWWIVSVVNELVTPDRPVPEELRE
jgi:hypothetical protein